MHEIQMDKLIGPGVIIAVKVGVIVFLGVLPGNMVVQLTG
jgi:hypothetical protein